MAMESPAEEDNLMMEDEMEEESGKEVMEKIKKQLFKETPPDTPVVHETTPAPSQKQAVLIYLRVRPKRPVEIQNEDPDCLHQTSEYELTAVPPPTSKTYLSSRANAENSQNFTFSKIFGPDTSQKVLFDVTFKPLLKDFINGQNCLVFTYGVTNSGSYAIVCVCLGGAWPFSFWWMEVSMAVVAILACARERALCNDSYNSVCLC